MVVLKANTAPLLTLKAEKRFSTVHSTARSPGARTALC
jgi:hypothetical protein